MENFSVEEKLQNTGLIFSEEETNAQKQHEANEKADGLSSTEGEL